MKKMMIIAMAAFMLMACNNSSDTGLPKEEAKALETSTVGAIKSLGESSSQVDASLTSAGYKKINGGYNPFVNGVSARVPMKIELATVAEATGDSVVYAYGLPDNYEKMNEEQAIAWLNKALADGKALILVTVTYDSDELTAMGTVFVIAKTDKANKTFTATSDNMFDELPSGKTNYGWMGTIADRDASGRSGAGKEYEDHSAFVSAIAKAEGITAQELAFAPYKGFSYTNIWINPNQQEEAYMLQKGLTTPICVGMYAVASGAAEVE